MVADALAPCITRTSASVILTICRIGKFLSYMRKDFNFPCQVNMEEWYILLMHFYVSYEKFSMLRVNALCELSSEGSDQYYLRLCWGSFWQHTTDNYVNIFLMKLFIRGMSIITQQGSKKHNYVIWWYLNKIAVIQAFSWIKIVFWLNFPLSWFQRIQQTTMQHWLDFIVPYRSTMLILMLTHS